MRRTAAASPQISVIMGVYNGERYLLEAVESILNQTFTDFEFLIFDDGSADSTPQILESLSDARLKVMRHENVGLTKSLNKGLKMARGAYIARQDADDISEPSRLAKQVAFLERNPEISLAGCWIKHIDDEGDVIGKRHYLTDPVQISAILSENNQFNHGSIMVRRESVLSIEGYREEFKYAQDYDLALRLNERYSLANIPEELYLHRWNTDMVSLKNIGEQRAYGKLAQKLCKQRRQNGKDDLEEGVAVKEILPEVYDIDPLFYQRYTVYLCLRQGNVRKARKAILTILKREPFYFRAYLHLALTFFGSWFMAKLFELWEKFRHGDTRY